MTAGKAAGARVEAVLGNLLRTGVAAAAVVVGLGALIYLGGHGVEHADYGTFRGEPAELRSLAGLLRSAASGQGRAIIQLGVVLLIATPIARVVFACGAFLRQRDWRYATISLVVLGVLAFSLLGTR